MATHITKLTKSNWRNHKWLYASIALTVVFIVGVYLGSKLFADSGSGYWLNLFTEMLGVLASTVLLGSIIKLIADRNLRRSLVTQMRSLDNLTARKAASELSDRGWTDLKGENLGLANLQSADLSEFSFQNCDLSYANLRNTVLLQTDLRHAYLLESDLTEAILQVERKTWTVEKLKDVYKIWDDIEFKRYLARDGYTPESILQELNEGGEMSVLMDENTVLPDGKRYHQGINLKYYTDSNYPNGKFKPRKGLRSIRLAVQGLLNTPIESEYRD